MAKSDSETKNYRAVVEKLAELESCFPNVAPRLLVNLTSDLHLMSGFDTPLLKITAKHQVPVLLESMVQIGAIVVDASRSCGYRPVLPSSVSDEIAAESQTASQAFMDYAAVLSERISRGNPYKLAAVNIPLTEAALEKVQKKIMPVLQQYASTQDVEAGVGVKLVFGFVQDAK